MDNWGYYMAYKGYVHNGMFNGSTAPINAQAQEAVLYLSRASRNMAFRRRSNGRTLALALSFKAEMSSGFFGRMRMVRLNQTTRATPTGIRGS